MKLLPYIVETGKRVENWTEKQTETSPLQGGNREKGRKYEEEARGRSPAEKHKSGCICSRFRYCVARGGFEPSTLRV